MLVDCGDGRTMVGFENHAGRTWLGDGVAPLGRVIAGAGNNGEDRTEGAGRSGSSAPTCTARCCRRTRGSPTSSSSTRSIGAGGPLEPLDDELEARTAEGAAAIARSERR